MPCPWRRSYIPVWLPRRVVRSSARLPHLGRRRPFGPPELVKALLDAGADVNVKDVRDMTPLMLAVGTDHQDPAIIQMLLDHGAKLEPKSVLGETAHDWARKIGLPPESSC